MSRNIWLYWTGHQYKLILILRKLIELHASSGTGYTVNLITPSNIKEYISEVPSCFLTLCPAHQADFVRVNVVCTFGGIWLDSDTLVIESLDPLFDLLSTESEGFFIKENNGPLCNGVFGSNANTPLLTEWKKRLSKKLESTKGRITWTAIGSDILDQMFKESRDLYSKYKIFGGLSDLYPVSFQYCVQEYIQKPYETYKAILRDFQPLILLVHQVYKHVESMSLEELLNSKMPLNYFIQTSLDNCNSSKEKLLQSS